MKTPQRQPAARTRTLRNVVSSIGASFSRGAHNVLDVVGGHTGTRRQRRLLLLGVVVLALIASGLGALWVHTGRSRAGANVPHGFIRFLDTQHNTGFNVDVAAGDPHVGEFTFVAPDESQYHGDTTADLQDNGDGTMGLHFTGDVQLLPSPDAVT
jgi:hypothetical protein